jgi:hypothetical protein
MQMNIFNFGKYNYLYPVNIVAIEGTMMERDDSGDTHTQYHSCWMHEWKAARGRRNSINYNVNYTYFARLPPTRRFRSVHAP